VTDAAQFTPHDVADLRRRLHAVNGELSVAILELELLLEGGGLDSAAAAVAESLNACRRAATIQREIWALLDERSAPPR
jgi:hypothetical protein